MYFYTKQIFWQHRIYNVVVSQKTQITTYHQNVIFLIFHFEFVDNIRFWTCSIFLACPMFLMYFLYMECFWFLQSTIITINFNRLLKINPYSPKIKPCSVKNRSNCDLSWTIFKKKSRYMFQTPNFWHIAGIRERKNVLSIFL